MKPLCSFWSNGGELDCDLVSCTQGEGLPWKQRSGQLQLAPSINKYQPIKTILTRVGSGERRQQRVLLSGSIVDFHHIVQGRLEQHKLTKEDWKI